ncbi:uncharacterized protein LOC132611821 [Lycium barbarum]|uniref:uncharacterized protein LOC132611821 n=1 Tax=Lycium barbarum TaxID=112863 RepID=UPI00293F1176|nr:uncharacterized protein LOC132611821 [Lycium barbarum]
MEPFHGPDEIASYRRSMRSLLQLFMLNVLLQKGWSYGIQLLKLLLNVQVPWIVGGDFNVILKADEKLGGLPFNHSKTDEFAHFVNNCGMMKLKFSGRRYTLWNGKTEEDCIFKRLDRHPEFLGLVQNNWCLDFAANTFTEFQAKMKKVKQALEKWSKDTYGNIFQQISTLEDVIKVKELQFELNPSIMNRAALHKAQANLNNYLHLQEEYWKQKSGVRWF